MKLTQFCIKVATFLLVYNVQVFAADNLDADWNIALGLCISAEGPLKDERAYFDGPMVYGVGDVNSAEDYCSLDTDATYERNFILFTADYVAEYKFDTTESKLVELYRYSVTYSLVPFSSYEFLEASWIEDPEIPNCKNSMFIRINQDQFDDNEGMLETWARGYNKGCKSSMRAVNKFMWGFGGFKPRFHRYIE